jgi:hypothetical protein
MTPHPAAEIRRQVIERPGHCCEDGLLHRDLAASTHQVDHVIAEKPGGQTALDNLILSYMVYNRRKGSDIGSIPKRATSCSCFIRGPGSGRIASCSDGVHRIGLTHGGRTTAACLQVNAFERLLGF